MDNATKLAKLDAMLDEIDRLRKQSDEKCHQLRRSITIQSIWPDAFEHGRVTSQVTGNPRRDLTFTMTMGNGEQRSMPLEEVPTILWPAAIKAEIRKLSGFQGSWKYHKILKGEDNATRP